MREMSVVRLVGIGVIVTAVVATASCATAQDRPTPPPPPTSTAPAPPPPPPPADVRVSAATASEEVAAILARKDAPDVLAEALITLSGALAAGDDGAGAEAALAAAVDLLETRLGPDAPGVGRPLAMLARLKQDRGDYTGALADTGRAMVLLDQTAKPDPRQRADLFYDRARALDFLGRNDEAEVAARESLRLRREHLGAVHELVGDSLNLTANTLTAQGRHAEADPLYRQVLGMYEVLYGPTDYHLAIVLTNLGNSLRRTGREHQAAPLYLRAVTIAERSGDKVLLAQCLINHGWFLHVTGDGTAAEQPFRRALALALEIVGPDHPFTGVARANLGYALSDQGRWAEAEAPFQQGLAAYQAAVGPDSPDLLATIEGYAAVLDHLGRVDEAEALYQRADTIAGHRLPPAHADSMAGAEKYAGFLIRQDRADEALNRVRAELAELLGQDGRGRDWRTRVRGARPLFARQVEASWVLAASTD